MNQVILMGRLTKDPEVSWKDDKCGTDFTLAVERYKGEADFITCKAFGKTAENIGKYFKKGRQILISGNIRTGSYDKDGRTVYYTKVWVDKFDFISGDKKSDEKTSADRAMPDEAYDGFAAAEEDIPF